MYICVNYLFLRHYNHILINIPHLNGMLSIKKKLTKKTTIQTKKQPPALPLTLQ